MVESFYCLIEVINWEHRFRGDFLFPAFVPVVFLLSSTCCLTFRCVQYVLSIRGFQAPRGSPSRGLPNLCVIQKHIFCIISVHHINHSWDPYSFSKNSRFQAAHPRYAKSNNQYNSNSKAPSAYKSSVQPFKRACVCFRYLQKLQRNGTITFTSGLVYFDANTLVFFY